jgi:hypothetical protein
MTDDIGLRLRRHREALGLDLDRVSEGTGVPRDYLEALEEGDHRRLPPGPYATAYVRSYRLFLKRIAQRGEDDTLGGTLSNEPSTWGTGMPPTPVPTPEGEDGPVLADPVVRKRPVPPLPETGEAVEPRVPLPLVRAIAAAAGLAFLLMLAVELSGEWSRWTAGVGGEPEVEVRMQLMRNARLKIWVDGELREDRLFGGREELRFVGRERVDVEVPGIEVVLIWFGDRTVSPLGQKGRARRLTFLAEPEVRG